MKKITLINPPWYNNTKTPIKSMNLGLSYIVAYLRSKRHEVTAIDALFDDEDHIVPIRFKYQQVYRVGLSYEEIAQRIPKDSDFIAISAPFSNHATIIKELSAHIKKIHPNRPIVIGGTYPSTSREDILSMDVDYAVCGEGEIPLEKMLSGEDPAAIRGVYSKKNGKLMGKGRADTITNLDDIPFPARDIFHYQEILDAAGPARIRVGTDIVTREGRGVPIITSRGCPYDCTFCSIHFVHGYRWRYRSAENVLAEITELVNKYHVNGLAIIDDHLAGKRDRFIKILDGLIERDLKIEWGTPNGIRVDYLDEEVMEKMKKAGCSSLVLGIQHGDPKMLERMGTKLDLNKVEDVVRIGSKLKLDMAAFFIIGHPGEDRKSFMRTIEYGRRLGKYGLKDFRINIARAYPKTKLFNYCKERDLFVKRDTENILIFPGDDTEANIKTEDFNPKELLWRRNYAKRKLMAVENNIYWNIVYYAERFKVKNLFKTLLPEGVWSMAKRFIYNMSKRVVAGK